MATKPEWSWGDLAPSLANDAREAALRDELAARFAKAIPEVRTQAPLPEPVLGESRINKRLTTDLLEGQPYLGDVTADRARYAREVAFSEPGASGLKPGDYATPNQVLHSDIYRGGIKKPSEQIPFERTGVTGDIPGVIEPRKWSIKDTKGVIERVQKGEPVTLKLDPAYGSSLELPSDEIRVTSVTPNGFLAETANGEQVHLMFDRKTKTIPGVIGVEHRDTTFPLAEGPREGQALRPSQELVATSESYEGAMTSAKPSAIKQREGLTIHKSVDEMELPESRGMYSPEIQREAIRRFREWEAESRTRGVSPEEMVHLDDFIEGRATLPEIVHKLDGGESLLKQTPEAHIKRIITDWLESKVATKPEDLDSGSVLDRYQKTKHTITKEQKRYIEKAWKKGVDYKTLDTLRDMEMKRRVKGYAKVLEATGDDAIPKLKENELVIKDPGKTADTVLDTPKQIEEVTKRSAEEANFTKPLKQQNLFDVINC